MSIAAVPSLSERPIYLWRFRHRKRLELAAGNTGSEPSNVLIGRVPAPTHFGPDTSGELLITSYTAGFYGLTAASGGASPASNLLSDTGLFSNLSTLAPASGLIEFAVNEPYWADTAERQRWLGRARR